MLDRRARDDGRRNRVGEMRSPFADAKHSIGRLAQHIISHEELVRDAHQISHILESHDVCMVDAVSYPPRPVADSHTTLDGVLNRMFSHSDTEKNEVKRILLEIDRQSHSTLFTDFLAHYSNGTPQVHAEVRVLQHFYKHQLKFVDNDRYIGCSKPSCTCCMLYFKHHPARMVVPESHQKIWPNWAPPMVQNFQKGDDESDCQLSIMNKINNDLRDDFTRQILACSVPPSWHPDSVSAKSEASPLASKCIRSSSCHNTDLAQKTSTLSPCIEPNTELEDP